MQEEAFLEDINMMLNTGDIPNLYENEDRLAIIEKVRVAFSHIVVSVFGLHAAYCKVLQAATA